MNEAQGQAGEAKLPLCRGRHPHLGAFEHGGCGQRVKLMLIGASSAMWHALAEAARRPGVIVRAYIDAAATDSPGTPTAEEIARHLRGGFVLRTKRFDGALVRNHAKLLVVDHRLLLVTSANFSLSAERRNIEYGQLTDNPGLAEAAERDLRDVEDRLYEQVPATPL